MKVRVGTLKRGDRFETLLTKREGSVLELPKDYKDEVGVGVIFDQKVGLTHRKALHPDILVDWIV